MRTAIIVLIAAVALVSEARAQDLLVRRDGTQTRVKVLEVSKKHVKYVRYSTESPVYILPVEDIDYIEYPNGDRDTFVPKHKPAVTVTTEGDTLKKWHGPVKVAVPYDQIPHVFDDSGAPVGQLPVYETGDIYARDGVKGIVVIAKDGGRHGVVMSLDETCAAWCSLPRRDLEATGAIDLHDGEQNMQTVERFVADHNLSWSDFPAFEWCRAKGKGWYLPAVNELWLLGTIYNGGSRVTVKKKVRKVFNDTLRANGGKPLNNIMFYHSSTESADARCSVYSHFNLEKPYTADGNKGDKLFVRAFHKF